ncbi:MAG: PEP-CTERM sorting domain-containing protein [Verrucomicrobiota bacterium]
MTDHSDRSAANFARKLNSITFGGAAALCATTSLPEKAEAILTIDGIQYTGPIAVTSPGNFSAALRLTFDPTTPGSNAIGIQSDYDPSTNTGFEAVTAGWLFYGEANYSVFNAGQSAFGSYSGNRYFFLANPPFSNTGSRPYAFGIFSNTQSFNLATITGTAFGSDNDYDAVPVWLNNIYNFGFTTIPFGTAPGTDPFYVGLRVDTVGGDTHFGWAQLQVGSVTVLEAAFNSTPNGAITIGQIPEPSTSLLLAAGATGLLAARRRRKKAA